MAEMTWFVQRSMQWSLWKEEANCGRWRTDQSLSKCTLTSGLGLFRQIRQGIANNTKGTAFVVYEDVMDAKTACDKLNGFNFQNRYLVGKSFRRNIGVPNDEVWFVRGIETYRAMG